MKNFSLNFKPVCVAAFAAVLFLCAFATAQDNKFFLDFREDEDSLPPVYLKDETNQVKKLIFGEVDVKGFRINIRLTGSFTRPAPGQTLYYVAGCIEDGKFVGGYRCKPESKDAGKIAILEKGKLLITIDAYPGNGLGVAGDLNGDGIDELLSYFGESNQGRYYRHAQLSSLAGGKYKKIKTLEGYASLCYEKPAVRPAAVKMATLITYKPRTDKKMPSFEIEYFKARYDTLRWGKIARNEFAKFKKENF